MRKQLKQYIRENIRIGGSTYTKEEVEDVKSWWIKVEKDCRDFLRELKKGGNNTFLLRGIRNADADIFIKHSRSDRWPKDTGGEVHEAFDEAFKHLFGWKARSENSVFCSGRYNIVDSYGDVCIIFPIGRFRYLWSDKITDLYSYTDEGNISTEPDDDTIEDWKRDWEDNFGEGEDGTWLYNGDDTGGNDKREVIQNIIDEIVEDLERQLDELDDDSDQIKELEDELEEVKSSKKIKDIEKNLEWDPATDWDSYKEMRKENWTSDYRELYNEVLDIIKNGNYKTNDLKGALNHPKGTEIMVKCDKYYVFNYEYKDLLDLIVFQDSDPDQLSFDF